MGKLRVLIVDDSKISRVMIAEHLRETDFEVCGMAADAVEALKLYEELRPDFVTMDMNLPDTNGLECSRRILALDADARILMISAMKDLKLITQGKAVGVRAFLQKPVSRADLVDTLYLIGHTGDGVSGTLCKALCTCPPAGRVGASQHGGRAGDRTL